MTALAAPSVDSRKARRVPGPKGRPVLGVLPELQADPLGYLSTVAADHGDIVALPMGPRTVYMLNDPSLIDHVLRANYRNYRKSDFYLKLRPVFGDGLILNDGEVWKRHRRMAQPAFHMNQLRTLADGMAQSARTTAEAWQTAADSGRAVDVGGAMMRVSLEVAVKALLGADLGPRTQTVMDSADAMLAEAERRIWSFADLPLWVPTKRNRIVREALNALDAVLLDVIAKRRRDGPGDDLLSMLIAARDDETGEGLSDAELLNEAKTIVVAGHETTGAALSWTLSLLAQHPSIRTQVEAEVDGVLAGRSPGFEDVPQLDLTRRVIQEAMRLYPPAWTISRTAIGDDAMAGYQFRKGATFMLCPYLIQRNARHWPNPERFDPDRFTREAEAARHAFAYFPFGGGARKCIGDRFAMMEMAIVIASVVQRYRLDHTVGANITPVPMISLRPGPDLPMTVTRRTVRAATAAAA